MSPTSPNAHAHMKAKVQQVLDTLPDNALWVEARGMLLSGRGLVLDFQVGPEPQGALFQQDIGLAVIVGKPSASLLAEVAELADELICPIECSEYIAQFFSGWSREYASLAQLPSSTDSALLYRADNCNPEYALISRLLPEQLAETEDIPELLQEELQQELDAGTEIFSTTYRGTPVSFCFPASCTETLWDISIDTLANHRRSGFAELCVRYAIRVMAEKGLAPVWGVVDSNHASRTLARKLGFEESFRISVFTRSNP